MRFVDYIEEKIWFIIFQVSAVFLITVYFKLFELPTYALIILDVIWILGMVIYLVITYILDKKEYENIVSLVDRLDEKYLIAEVLKKPNNFKNEAYYYALKKACKSMNDKIVDLESELKDYRDYIESFAHEIKTPISAISLACDNREDRLIKNQIKKIDNIVEQMLFYARSDSVEKDYFVRKLLLEDVIHTVIMDYRYSFLQKKISLDVYNLENYVYIDEKWITFIICQVLQNSIKYVNKTEKVIKIHSENNPNNVVLIIEDNGDGILDYDLPRVFEYGFTGTDRQKQYSTGIGLYLCKKLCDKMNLNINIESEFKRFTRVSIIFPKTSLYRQETT
ncbi:sensor histidine kinase [Intestinibacter sp.]